MGEIYQSVVLEGMKGNKLRVNALIDTGANINAISHKTALYFYKKEEIENVRKQKLNFTNNISKKYPIIFLNVVVMGESRVFPFAVIEEGFGSQVLLGVRFFEDTNMAIDFKKDKIRFMKLSKRKGKWL